MGELYLGSLKARGDNLLGFGAAFTQTSLELLKRRRLDEHERRIGTLSADLKAALHVDLKDHLIALSDVLLDRRLGRAVAVAVVLRPFEKAVVGGGLQEHGGRGLGIV